MNIFLDTLSLVNTLILFDDDRNILSKKEFNVFLNESSKLIFEIDDFMKQNNILYNQIKNIVCTSWPGSFTWIRSTIIVVNTISFVNPTFLTWIIFFDLFDNYPIIKKSSKRDSFIQKSQNSEIEILQNEDILKYISENDIKTIYWDFLLDWVNTVSTPDYEKIIKHIPLNNKKRLVAEYLKKPSIT